MPVLLTKHAQAPVPPVETAIRDRLSRGEPHSFIYVVPTKRKLRELRRSFIEQLPGKVSAELNLFTMETFAVRLFSLLCPPRALIGGPAQAVLMDTAIRRVSDRLEYFRLRGSARHLPRGTFEKLLNVVNDLKERGVYPTALHEELASADQEERSKLRDILMIYEEYDRLLGDRFVDPAGILKDVDARWVKGASEEAFRGNFPMVDTLYVAGFDEFSDPELTLVDHLASIASLAMVIEFDYHPGNDGLFGHLRENYRKFSEMGFQKATAEAEESGDFTSQVVRRLFTPAQAGERLRCEGSVSVVRAPDREAETEIIARLIRRLVRERPGRDLSRICVAMIRPQTYTQLVREVFGKYGIPANITDRYSLDRSPAVLALLALLAVQQKNFQLRDVIRALSSRYIRIASGGGEVDVSNLLAAAARLKVPGGLAAWKSRIDAAHRQAADALAGSEDDAERAEARRERDRLLRARADLDLLASHLAPFAAPMTPAEFSGNVMRLSRDIRLLECILEGAAAGLPEESLESDTRAFRSFEAFVEEFPSIMALEGRGAIREPLGFYLDRIRSALPQVRYNIRQRYGYGVLVTSFEETRGLQFDVMIMAGLVDGEVPPVYQPEIFFSTSRRARAERYHLTEQRYLFYQAVTNFREHLTLTYPEKDEDTELVPSTFIDALEEIIAFEDLRGGLPEAEEDAVESPEDLLFRAAGTPPDAFGRLGARLSDAIGQVRHAVEVERARIGGAGFPEYRGSIGAALAPEEKAELETLRHRVFSVTQLESYGACPFQYFADAVLRLEPAPEPEEGLAPRERGAILHEALFEFYVRRRELGLPLLSGCSEEEFSGALRELMECAAKKLDEMAMPDVVRAVERDLVLGTDTRKGILKEFLENERRKSTSVRPAYFEVPFGRKTGPRRKADPGLAHDEPIDAGDVRLRGKIDRIDAGERHFTIVDYKTGATVAARKEIDAGISLQLPVYLYAVEKILAESAGLGLQGVAGIYYVLSPPVRESVGIGSREHAGVAFEAGRAGKRLFAGDAELREAIDRAVAFVNDYVSRIAQGEFPVEPAAPPKTCAWCDYKPVCRIQSLVAAEGEEEE